MGLRSWSLRSRANSVADLLRRNFPDAKVMFEPISETATTNSATFIRTTERKSLGRFDEFPNHLLRQTDFIDVTAGTEARGPFIQVRLGRFGVPHVYTGNFDYTTGLPVASEIKKRGWFLFSVPLRAGLRSANSIYQEYDV